MIRAHELAHDVLEALTDVTADRLTSLLDLMPRDGTCDGRPLVGAREETVLADTPPAHPDDVTAQVQQRRVDAVIAGRSLQLLVHPARQVVVLRDIAGDDELLGRSQLLLELREDLCAPLVLGGDRGERGLERLAQLEDLDDVLEADLGHEDTSVRDDPNETFAVQLTKGFSHRCTADAQVRREPRLRERLARLVPPGEDRVTDVTDRARAKVP